MNDETKAYLVAIQQRLTTIQAEVLSLKQEIQTVLGES